MSRQPCFARWRMLFNLCRNTLSRISEDAVCLKIIIQEESRGEPPCYEPKRCSLKTAIRQAQLIGTIFFLLLGLCPHKPKAFRTTLLGSCPHKPKTLRTTLLGSCPHKPKAFRPALVAIVCTIFHLNSYAQEAIPIGQWRTHFAYRHVAHVLPVKDRIYAASDYGLFYLDQSDNSLTTLSTPNGLSDVGITAMAYQRELDILLLAYQSGTIDILTGNRIVPFSLIQDADKAETIQHIDFDDSTVYLSTSQGVRVLTLAEDALNIRESYTGLGQAGDDLAVYGSIIVRDSIFLATATGVIGNALNTQVNRQDFRSWKRLILSDSVQNMPVRHLVLHQDIVYAGTDDGVYQYDGRWQQTLALPATDTLRALRSANNTLIAVAGNAVLLIDNNGTVQTTSGVPITTPQDAVMDSQGNLWIGDSQHGLVAEGVSYLPNGPASDNISKVRDVNNSIIALPAMINPSLQQGFNIFRQGSWQSYQDIPATTPLLDAVYDASNQAYYFATFGNGLMRWDGDTAFSLLGADSEGSTLENNQLTSLTIDDAYNLWMTSLSSLLPVHAYSPATKGWQAFGTEATDKQYPMKVVLAEDGNPWTIVSTSAVPGNTGDNILVFDRQTGKHLLVKKSLSGGALPGEQITALVRDRDGLLWLGGNEGVAFFSNPWDAFAGVDVVRPVFQTQYLLLGEYVTAMAVDAANRKWIGTRKGLWLFDETGESLIYHFTTENSPLVSDNILDITLNDTDGEVFVATDRGLISYRGTATQPAMTHQSVKIFPNPVSPDFTGMVGIQGVVGGASVKITSIAGVLVRSLEAEGGTATWDMRDYQGQRVGTGVYLVFSASSNGEETFVGKIAIVK